MASLRTTQLTRPPPAALPNRPAQSAALSPCPASRTRSARQTSCSASSGIARASKHIAAAAATGHTSSNGARPGQPAVRSFDFLVLGSGIAGLSYALKVAEQGSVAIITKAEAVEGSTRWAQGGICAVLDDTDTPESHIYDTIVAGDFENDRRAVEAVCNEGTAAVLELAEMGAKFTQAGTGGYHLTREGGHSHHRIVHAADATGAEIERALLAKIVQHPGITMFEHHLATDLVTNELAGVPLCLGTDVLDLVHHQMVRFVAPVTMLATGGLGQVFPATTNPAVATGDGQAMAQRAHANLAGMEFVQFHPTGFAGSNSLAGQQTFLISEAVRGEGGHLLNLSGHRFMGDYDTRMELASRDIVARAIYEQMIQNDQPHVLLDISHRPPAEVLEHFPTIAARVRAAGFDMTKEAFPVAPVQHYMCGGVQSGLFGETSLAGLYAIGEVACTGLHGANRLASNSLLEGLVFANRAVHATVQHAERTLQFAGLGLHHASTHASFAGSTAAGQLSAASHAWVADRRKTFQGLMGSSAGIIRRQADMKQAVTAAAALSAEIEDMRKSSGVVRELVELQNIVGSGSAILKAASARTNSRGAHFCVDYPPDSRDKKAELSRLLGPSAEPVAPTRYLAPLVPAASGPSRLGKGKKKGSRGLVAGTRPSLKRSKSTDISSVDVRAQSVDVKAGPSTTPCDCASGSVKPLCCMYHD